MEPIEVDGKFVILRVREVYPSRLQTFEEVRTEVEARLIESKHNEVALREAGRLLEGIPFKAQ